MASPHPTLSLMGATSRSPPRERKKYVASSLHTEARLDTPGSPTYRLPQLSRGNTSFVSRSPSRKSPGSGRVTPLQQVMRDQSTRGSRSRSVARSRDVQHDKEFTLSSKPAPLPPYISIFDGHLDRFFRTSKVARKLVRKNDLVRTHLREKRSAYEKLRVLTPTNTRTAAWVPTLEELQQQDVWLRASDHVASAERLTVKERGSRAEVSRFQPRNIAAATPGPDDEKHAPSDEQPLFLWDDYIPDDIAELSDANRLRLLRKIIEQEEKQELERSRVRAQREQDREQRRLAKLKEERKVIHNQSDSADMDAESRRSVSREQLSGSVRELLRAGKTPQVDDE